MKSNLGTFTVLAILFITLSSARNALASGGAVENLQKAQFEGVKSQHAFNRASIAVFRQSLERYEHASDCQASCPEGCCQSGDSLMAEAAMYQMIANVTENRSKQSYLAALTSCQAINQISSNPAKNCEKDLEAVVPLPRDASAFDKLGQCTNASSAACELYSSTLDNQILNMNKGAKGQFKDYFSEVKMNDDQTVSLRLSSGVKKVSMADFNDPKSLEKLGLNPKRALKLSSKFNRLNTMIQTKNVTTPSSVVGEKPNESALPGSNSADAVTTSHQLTSPSENFEGLKNKDHYFVIGDEKIGSWRNDIFIMMNKRYHELNLNQQFLD